MKPIDMGYLIDSIKYNDSLTNDDLNTIRKQLEEKRRQQKQQTINGKKRRSTKTVKKINRPINDCLTYDMGIRLWIYKY